MRQSRGSQIFKYSNIFWRTRSLYTNCAIVKRYLNYLDDIIIKWDKSNTSKMKSRHRYQENDGFFYLLTLVSIVIYLYFDNSLKMIRFLSDFI